jgi:hypothetical protein
VSPPSSARLVAENPVPLDIVIDVDDPEVAWSRLAAIYGKGPLSSALEGKISDYIAMALGTHTADLIDEHAPAQIGIVGLEKSGESDVAFSFGLVPGSSRERLDGAFQLIDDNTEFSARTDHRPICSYHETKAAKPRLVCAASPHLLQQVKGELRARNGHRSGVDFRLEMRSSFFRKLAAERRSQPGDNADGREAGRQIALDTLNNIEALGCSLKFDVDDLRVSTDMTMKPNSGTSAFFMLGPTSMAHPPKFERIPSDTFVALTHSGTPRDVLLNAWGPILQALDQDLKRESPQSMVDAVTTEMMRLFLTGGPLRFMAGPSAPSKPATASAQRRPKSDASPEPFTPASFGWWAVVLDEPIDKWTTGIRNILDLDAQTFVLAPGEPEKTPTVSPLRTEIEEIRTKGAAPSRNSLRLKIRHEPNPEYRGAADEKQKRKSLIYIVVTGDERTTYIVVSEQEHLAFDRAQELFGKKGPASTSGGWYVEPQSGKHTRALGFATPRGLLMSFPPEDPPDTAENSRRVLNVLASLPNDGNTPIPFEFYSDATETPLTGHFEFRLGADLVRALIDLAGNRILQ